jgi:hypothetical protein
MLMRYSMLDEYWYEPTFGELKEKVRCALYEDTPRADDAATAWHQTRVFEYPWAIQYTPPRGHILDVGHNLQFSVALLEAGHTVAMHTVQTDIPVFGRIFGWEDDHTGGISAANYMMRHSDRATFVVGYLDTLTYAWYLAITASWRQSLYDMRLLL